MALISVIVPVYKAERYIEDCVHSILAQTICDFELILVEDGSPDRSGEICDALASEDSRICVIHKENGGAATARNAGLDVAVGRYIAFIDADDYIHPQYLQLLLALLESSDADFSMCHYQFFEGQIPEGTVLSEGAINNRTLLSGPGLLDEFHLHCRRVSLISLCMKLFKKELFDNLRIPEGYIEEDSMSLPLILERAQRIVKSNEKLYYWRETPGSVTRSGFTPKSFAYIEVSRFQAEFFRQRSSSQAKYCIKEYLYKVLKYYYRVREQRPELMKEYKPYLKQYRRLFPCYIRAQGLCFRERLAYTLFLFCPEIAKKFYMQVYRKKYQEETW